MVADFSSTDFRHSWESLIKDDINNCLNFLGSADTNSVISGDAD
jgi:hypothetical protein